LVNYIGVNKLIIAVVSAWILHVLCVPNMYMNSVYHDTIH
jgi:hypothetical protein